MPTPEQYAAPRNTGGKTALARKRIQMGYTQRQVSEAIGVDFTVYARWDKGMYDIPAKRLVKLARFFGCHAEELVDEDE